MSVPRQTAERIFIRDGFLCRACKTKLPPYYEVKGPLQYLKSLVVDHVMPGAGNEDSNLQTLCWKCNSSKSGQDGYTFDLVSAIRLLGRPVAFYPSIARVVGMKESLLVCQLAYWTPRTRNAKGAGWFYKSADELLEETGLTYREQKRARIRLVNLGILQENYDRTEHRMYFRLIPQGLNIILALDESSEEHLTKRRVPTNQPSPATRPNVVSYKEHRLLTDHAETKTRVQSRDARNRFDDEMEQRRKIEAKQKREAEERELHIALYAGSGPR